MMVILFSCILCDSFSFSMLLILNFDHPFLNFDVFLFFFFFILKIFILLASLSPCSGCYVPFYALEKISDSWILALPFIFQIIQFFHNSKVSKMLENINWFGMSTITISSWGLNNFCFVCYIAFLILIDIMYCIVMLMFSFSVIGLTICVESLYSLIVRILSITVVWV